jgi:hypothetical protein
LFLLLLLLLLQDYAAILARAEAEADVVLWDGGNNDTPFYKPGGPIFLSECGTLTLLNVHLPPVYCCCMCHEVVRLWCADVGAQMFVRHVGNRTELCCSLPPASRRQVDMCG